MKKVIIVPTSYDCQKEEGSEYLSLGLIVGALELFVKQI